MRDAWCTLAASFVGLLCLTGCRTAEAGKGPADWPRDWEGRTLHEASGIAVYASDTRSAAEVGAEVRAAAREFERATGVAAATGVVVVSEPGDRDLRVTGKTREVLNLTLNDVPADAAPDHQRGREMAGRLIERVKGCVTFCLVKDERSDIPDLPEVVRSSASFVMLTPGPDRLEAAGQSIVDEVMAELEGNALQRMVARPFMGMVREKAVQAFEEARATALLEALGRATPLNADQRSRLRKLLDDRQAAFEDAAIEGVDPSAETAEPQGAPQRPIFSPASPPPSS